MGMVLSDFWPVFCRSIQASEDADIDRKQDALNLGIAYLLKRCIELLPEDQIPKDYLSDPTDLTNDAATNRILLPSDFVKLYAVWRQTGSGSDRYRRLDGRSILTYDQFLLTVAENFFDSSFTGDILYVAIKEPYIYLDKYITDAGSTTIKIQYYQEPSDVVVFERLVVGSSANFAVNDIIEGGTSNATATIYQIPGSTTIDIFTKDYDGTFQSGETITNAGLGSTTISSITSKPATLKLTKKYFQHMLEAAGLQYHILRGSDEIEARSETLDAMIMNLGEINKNRTQMNWGWYDNVR